METLPVQDIAPEAPLSLGLAMQLAQWADERKAENIRLYEVQDLCSYADYILICSGTSERHVQALRDYLRRQGKKSGNSPMGTEGHNAGQWLLLDFGDVIVHLFYEPVRDYYDLDRMWSEAPRVELSFQPSSPNAMQFDDEEDDEDLDE